MKKKKKTLLPLQLRNMNLVAQRELCEVQLRRGEVLAEVGAVQVKEMRTLMLGEERKGSIQRLVENYIRATPTDTPAASAWLNNRPCVKCSTILICSVIYYYYFFY